MTDETEIRLTRLAANARAGQWSLDDIDWQHGPRPPVWITARQARFTVSQLYYGEIATARICRRLMSEVPEGAARACLSLQIADEERHAEAYRRYLERLGGILPMSDPLKWALVAAENGPFGPLGAIAAFHIVVEGEYLRIQSSLTRFLSCPLFRRINRRIARDEARHAAFGKTYLKERLAALPPRRQQEMYDWLQEIWQQAADSAQAQRGHTPGDRSGAQWLLRLWLSSGWRHHQRALAQIGLHRATARGIAS